jgi:hypothetical protein
MVALFKSRVAYLGISFALFLIALPLVSIGSTTGPRVLLWTGFAALCVGALIPPMQRLLFAPGPSAASRPDNENAS